VFTRARHWSLSWARQTLFDIFFSYFSHPLCVLCSPTNQPTNQPRSSFYFLYPPVNFSFSGQNIQFWTLISKHLNLYTCYARLDFFTEMKIQVVVFWVKTPCSVVVEYKPLRRSCCTYLHFTLKIQAARSSETLVSCHKTTRPHNSEDFGLNSACIRGPFAKFVDWSYYSELEYSEGEVTVSFSKYLSWQTMHFLQRSTHFSKTCCRQLITSKFLASELPFHGWKSPEISWGEIWTEFLEKVDPWNPIRTSAIQSRSRPMRFLGISNHETGAPRQEISKWSTVCSTFSRSGWSVVRSASLT
jgi:hypothetical protein